MAEIVKLPYYEEMLRRLLEVSHDRHLQKNFFPILLVHNEQYYSPEGVVLIIRNAIDVFTKSLPSLRLYMIQMMPQLIEALIPNEIAAKEAKNYAFKESLILEE